MIKKISRYTLQQIFIESLEECDSFRIIDGLNPFHIMLNGKELYIYIKNLSPSYFTNPDVWRVQLPKKEEFETIKEGNIDFVLLGYDADNDVWCRCIIYTCSYSIFHIKQKNGWSRHEASKTTYPRYKNWFFNGGSLSKTICSIHENSNNPSRRYSPYEKKARLRRRKL